MKTIVIGVMSQDQIRARTIAIAKGEYEPKPGEPTIWFTSMKSVAEVLSDQNRERLKVTEAESGCEVQSRQWLASAANHRVGVRAGPSCAMNTP